MGKCLGWSGCVAVVVATIALGTVLEFTWLGDSYTNAKHPQSVQTVRILPSYASTHVSILSSLGLSSSQYVVCTKPFNLSASNTPALNGRSAFKALAPCDAPRCRVFFARVATHSRIFFAEAALLTHTRSTQHNATQRAAL